MPRAVRGEAVPTLAADDAWHQFKYFNPATAEDPRLSFASGWRRRELELIKGTDWHELANQIGLLNTLIQGVLGNYDADDPAMLDPEMRKAVLRVLVEQAKLSGLIERLDRLTALFEEWRVWHEVEEAV
jgi:hypothetical protein